MIDKGEKKAGFEPKEDIWSWFVVASAPPQPQADSNIKNENEEKKKGGE